MFVKIVDGVTIEAPLIYTTDDGIVIKNFTKYLDTMNGLELFDEMYGFYYVNDSEVVIDKDNFIKELKAENALLKQSIDDLLMYTIEDSIDQDFRLCLIEINYMGV